MASKDKTSKTARVMNLLSKKPDPAQAEEGAAPAAPAAPVPPIVTSMAPDAAVSVQIKSALEDALEGELGSQAPAAPVQAAPAPQPEPEPDPTPVQVAPAPQPEPAPVQPAPQPEPAPAPQPEPAPAPQPEPAPAPQPVQAAPEEERQFLEPENPGYINVMQVLVEEKAPKYVEMFGLCTCKRCMEDVKAYTLNHLPPKYVVLEPGDRVPRLTVYEGKFSSDITAQLLQACKAVMETPHHSRA